MLAISYYKFRKPSMIVKELRRTLIDDGITQYTLSDSMISKILKNMKFTKKKLTMRPREALTTRKHIMFNNFVEVISNINPMTTFFYEEGVVRKMETENMDMHQLTVGQWNYKDMHQMQHSLLNFLHGSLGINHYSLLT